MSLTEPNDKIVPFPDFRSAAILQNQQDEEEDDNVVPFDSRTNADDSWEKSMKNLSRGVEVNFMDFLIELAAEEHKDK